MIRVRLPSGSTDLLARALELYGSHYERVRAAFPDEPDLGVDVTFACGHRSLRARLSAASFRLAPETDDRFAEVAGALADADPSIEGLEWLERFPRDVLRLLERRRTPGGSPGTRRRRWLDRQHLEARLLEGSPS